jgi:hypothetical protein
MPHDFTKQWFPRDKIAKNHEAAKRALAHAQCEVERATRHKQVAEKALSSAYRSVLASCPPWADFLAEVKAHPGAKWRWISRWNSDADRTFHLSVHPNADTIVQSAVGEHELYLMESNWPHHFTTALLWREEAAKC